MSVSMPIPSDFPEDCLHEVLSRLPPHSLMRFRSVSKSWCALIDSPEFIRLHLNRSTIDSIKSPQFVFLAYPFLRNVQYNMQIRTQIWGMRTDENLDVYLRELAPPVLNSPAYVVGCCNGLICMRSRGTTEMALWNPWIRKSFVLPEITYPNCQEGRRIPSYCGFGYNDLSDEYKVVKFVLREVEPNRRLCIEVYVYGTKYNYWRELPNFPYAPLELFIPGTGSGVLANWALHWRVLIGDDIFIAAIDLRTEEYRFMPIPEALQSKLLAWPNTFFGVVGGCLCIIPPLSHMKIPSSCEISVWLMRDYGVNDSWTKLNVIVPGYKTILLDFLLLPIELSEEDKTLLALQRQGELVVQYDIKNQILVEKVKKNVSHCFCGYTEFPGVVKGYKWVPSIVPVPHSSEKKVISSLAASSSPLSPVRRNPTSANSPRMSEGSGGGGAITGGKKKGSRFVIHCSTPVRIRSRTFPLWRNTSRGSKSL